MKVLAAAAFALAVSLTACARGPTGAPAPSPGAARGSAYDISLDVADNLETATGSLRLRWSNPSAEALDHLQFFLFPNLTAGGMDVVSCEVNGTPAGTTSEMRNARLLVALPSPLEPGAATDVAVQYRIRLPMDPSGENGGFSRSESVLALAWCWPVVLDPSTWGYGYPKPWADYLVKEQSSYSLRLSYPARLRLAAPGSVRLDGEKVGRARAEIRLDPARDLFVALTASPAVAEARAGAVTVRCFAPEGRQEAAEFAAEAGARALGHFARRFGPYPFPTLILAAVPLASYGLEFPGIIALSERIFNLSAAIDGVPVRALLESTVAHETAHQWFYGMVGNDQVKEPWLDEALAQYATLLYFQDTGGPARANAFAASFDSRWERVQRADIPVGLPVESYSQKEYGAIVYGRGPLFLRTLAESMGNGAFDALLRGWVRRFSGTIATTRDFMQLASETAGRSLDPLFAAWVLSAAAP